MPLIVHTCCIFKASMSSLCRSIGAFPQLICCTEFFEHRMQAAGTGFEERKSLLSTSQQALTEWAVDNISGISAGPCSHFSSSDDSDDKL